MRIVCIFLLFFYFSSNAQSFSIKEIICKPKEKHSKIIFPMIISGSSTADRLMNTAIREEVLWGENKAAGTRQILELLIKENSLADLWYEVNFKKNGILSMAVYAEGCGAYCEGTYHYFNFDVETGKNLTIDDLLLPGMADSFKTMFFRDNAASLIEYKNSIKTSLNVGSIDSSVYDWIIELIDTCITRRQIDGFHLSENKISILNYCSFPHAIRAYSPGDGYAYPMDVIKPFLKSRFRSRIITNKKK